MAFIDKARVGEADLLKSVADSFDDAEALFDGSKTGKYVDDPGRRAFEGKPGDAAGVDDLAVDPISGFGFVLFDV